MGLIAREMGTWPEKNHQRGRGQGPEARFAGRFDDEEEEPAQRRGRLQSDGQSQRRAANRRAVNLGLAWTKIAFPLLHSM